MKNEVNGGYFVIIPQLVYGNKNISPRSALVFGLIVSLATGKNAYCYASNSYMAELLNVSERTISSCIAELKAEQLIDVKVSMNQQTRNVYRRITTFWSRPLKKQAYNTPKKTEPEWFEGYIKQLDHIKEAV